MAKIMSFLEKLNVIEKVNTNEIKNEIKNDEAMIQNDVNIEEIKEVAIEENVELKPYKEKPAEISFDYNSNLEVDEIYEKYNIDNNSMNSIFMLENFINALPQNLPNDVKRNSVLNILSASKLELYNLIENGNHRVKVLNEFYESYNRTTLDSINQYKEEIKRLKETISSYEQQIKIKERMLEEQGYKVDYELQKICNIINFFEGHK
ncbi:hypothetical protein [Desnuesiella massiliensis]|uniref:hypothetical protein n=1 Tax=Desnuesiella massiliensis TaxID=1650662 RepID=UPI0006E32A96|nr:hypothetical protein [Desnuesiella massiliensis]